MTTNKQDKLRFDEPKDSSNTYQALCDDCKAIK